MTALLDWPPHFSQAELQFSENGARAGIVNTCPQELIQNLLALAEWLEVLRARLAIETGRQYPIRVISGYRNPALNKLVGGSKTSAHMQGYAADIIVPGMSVDDLFAFIRKHMKGEGWDQIIHEFDSWVHVGLAAKGERGQCLKAIKQARTWPLKPETVYIPV